MRYPLSGWHVVTVWIINGCVDILFNIVFAKRAEVGLKGCGVCRASFDLAATSDEGRDRWTFYVIMFDGMANIHLESLHFTTLNLAENSEVLPMRASSK